MRKIAYKFFVCFVTGLIGGILLGCTLMSTLVSYRIDKYHEEIMLLKTRIEESDAKYNKLKESFDSMNKKKFLVSDIQVFLIFKGNEEDDFDKMQLEKYIKDRYQDLLWKEVKSIDMDLVVKLVDEDIYRIENKNYRLGVNRVLISDVFKIWVTVKKID
ncbi:MAG TPA: hypothetical protein DEF39_05380 [Hungateiclostridium thermocellum]|jgi:hypothetical protein|uniref:Sporulation membrane protein YtrI C-terminal domain-containing protein n=3 Tax=Acetivibrio thermocellus TaxID=1515 RepID=A3DBH8_ACET2|nr:hypothetical protein [Acetivibrio thermocellus]CDG34749.1 hypothetical protein CTHBC1_0071 [Acetivibrio thermocellus BC1]ABN51307.1 hypothetical protein Cthe_0066 [Acetivibrio thermocellus ATCC 27405]ADU75206.1 hypothetical protein Clo1313_2166 [Acetivibrio thermocellus DSM 1313]ALX09181.1 hypothetical protein AD2_02193 [Acetivibrio thermocellus AD2]ANV76933.1 hypothetical protein LQRI_2192 [Acetivibrio thermocellus DSM 2360]